MQIGEFAKICDTKISVLRHYDKEGLLAPDYVDHFTGYRYYSQEQKQLFVRITALKKAGFTLGEIKAVLSSCQSNEQLLILFENKKTELIRTMENLMEAERIILKEREIMNVVFYEENNRTYAKSGLFDANDQNLMREEVERAILVNGYQRISSFLTYGNQYTNQVSIACEVIKLLDSMMASDDNVAIEFENDPSVVGKWQTVGEYAVQEDFYGDIGRADYTAKEIYFLPNGQRYWCYSWSKGKLICLFGDRFCVNDYHVEEYDGNRYMFVDFKSYEYRRGGKPKVLVLRQLDNVAYSKDELARKDNIDMPFVEDKEILGKWEVRALCQNMEEFVPSERNSDHLFFKSIEFKQNGEVISIYGDKTICGQNMQTWTKGYVLEKWHQTACAYKISKIGDAEYLFVEWKSGDYQYGGMEPQYYIFTRQVESAAVR